MKKSGHRHGSGNIMQLLQSNLAICKTGIIRLGALIGGCFEKSSLHRYKSWTLKLQSRRCVNGTARLAAGEQMSQLYEGRYGSIRDLSIDLL